MSEFKKYQSLSRLGDQVTDGILDGYVHVFFKIDGTNSSLWHDGNKLFAGSRNRLLSTGSDNAGFYNASLADEKNYNFFNANPKLRLYGEWLVPHSLKSYRDDAWRNFYVFDVLDEETNTMVPFEVYEPLLKEHDINYIPPLAIIKNPTNEDIYRLMEKTGQFLVKDGEGKGEGLVLKNYDYKNKYGEQIWAKLISNEFKEMHHKEMGAPLINGSMLVEERILDFATEEFFLKEQAKIVNDLGEWTPKMIPRYLGVTWYTFLKEETPNFLKEFINPTVNFRLLQNLFLKKAKKVIGL